MTTKTAQSNQSEVVTKKQEILSNNVLSLANTAFVTLVIGQILAQAFDVWLAIVGVLVLGSIYVFIYITLGRQEV